MKTTVEVQTITRYIRIKLEASKENAWGSAMYILIWQVHREYLVGKHPFTTKKCEQPVGHCREGSTRGI